MTSTTTPIALAPTYRKALKTWRPVILYFGNQHCPACEEAGPIFRGIAEPYRQRADIYMLNTSESPRHPNVTGTPTVLFYKDGRLLKKLKGIGTPQTLAADFVVHIGKVKPRFTARKPKHDLAWLRRTLRRLCTVARAHQLSRV
ncbi:MULTISPECIES: thioredoxin family protein [unclassified Pseudomonas]|uniref:thioredoxin family protein n=1 Tax=unclassified Pseudomonas TaxID=196821 RepID=UPI001913EC98|nr:MULTISPECIES: thioredoxin family protein [unclassified Pseudomonas]MBK5552951.1 thioredoxin family protein [Pseudomonas sp. TH03]MEB0224670.1 thioredoxin family protein [Pseudomonas sp. 5S1]MEB0294673.1 thioredoxin family protein [Pseudomonas sp. 10S4]WPX16924.1 thioredoxin family protein [Pseudomonas sp. 10S4]